MYHVVFTMSILALHGTWRGLRFDIENPILIISMYLFILHAVNHTHG